MTPWPLLAYANRMPSLVLDAGIVATWLLTHRSTKYASDVQWHLLNAVAVVPSLWLASLADTLLAAERAGETTRSKVHHFLNTLPRMSILIDDETEYRAWGDTLDLARLHNLGVPDAAYLELALRLNLPLATTDAAITRAAPSAAATLFTP